jgi:ADP-ribose pyrophosphatase
MKYLPIIIQGMVDPGELVSVTVKKEFGEEALNTLEMTEAEKAEMSKMVEKFLSDGDEVCLLFKSFLFCLG